MEQPGYQDDMCHFCGGKGAAFGRAEDAKPSGPFFDACQACAEKPYPQPKNFQAQEATSVQQQNG